MRLTVELLSVSDAQVLRVPCQPLQSGRHVVRAMNCKGRSSTVEEDLALLKQAIVRNVSHELVTPTQQAKAAIALVRDELGENELVRLAAQAIARLERVIDNVTQLMDTRALHPEATLLRETAYYAQVALVPHWGETTLRERIRAKFDIDTPAVYADKQGVEIVLRLLLDNALKFSEGEVKVSAREDDGWVEISIADRGIGMDTRQCEAIFEPFTQLDYASTRQYGGVGVGLAIARRILEQQGSRLQVESEKGEGSRFSFLLPTIARYTAQRERPAEMGE